MTKQAIPRRPTASAPQEVRIIGGQWKRTPLPVANRPGLRPTPARVRETLFNWLGQDLTGLRCIDAFAGTGALGLEAASRGASEVLLVEKDAGLVQALSALKMRLKADGVRITRGDGVAELLKRAGQGLDLVFLDPPFAEDGNAPLFLAALRAARAVLSDDGLVYLEAPRAWGADELASLGLQLHRQGKAGVVHYHLLRTLAAQ